MENEIQVISQPTPNPNALKFLCDRDLRSEGKITFTGLEECLTVPLAATLYRLGSIKQLYFFQNTLTVTKHDEAAWQPLEAEILQTIKEKVEAHDPDFEVISQKKEAEYEGELAKIDEILSRTVRPALQMDGGDLKLLSLDKKVLTVNYEGACHSCPSAFSGTLVAIENILRDEYNEDLEVISI